MTTAPITWTEAEDTEIMRLHIVDGLTIDGAQHAVFDKRPSFNPNARERWPEVRPAKQAALDALDVLLSSGYPGHRDKLAALREVEAAAKRLADGIDRDQKYI